MWWQVYLAHTHPAANCHGDLAVVQRHQDFGSEWATIGHDQIDLVILLHGFDH